MVPQAVIETASAPYQGAVITFILLRHIIIIILKIIDVKKLEKNFTTTIFFINFLYLYLIQQIRGLQSIVLFFILRAW